MVDPTPEPEPDIRPFAPSTPLPPRHEDVAAAESSAINEKGKERLRDPSRSGSHASFDPPALRKTATVPNMGRRAPRTPVDIVPMRRIADIGPPRPPASLGQILVPEKKVAPDPTWSTSLKNTVKSSWFNVLLVFVPVSWALHFADQNDVVIFVVSFIAVIPLAGLLSFATEQLAIRVGESLGGLLNATFGNAVELLISILALVGGDVDLVQAAMIGSVLSNTLLVLGMCYFAGGLRFHEQLYQVASAQLQISLLGISITAIILPAAYDFAVGNLTTSNSAEATAAAEDENVNLLAISRGLSFMLLSVYAMYLVFMLWTHAYLFKMPRSKKRPHETAGEPKPSHVTVFPHPSWMPSFPSLPSIKSRHRPRSASSDSGLSGGAFSHFSAAGAIEGAQPAESGEEATKEGLQHPAIARAVTNATSHHSGGSSESEDDDEEEEEIPKVKALWALILLCVVTAVTGVTAEWLLDSIEGVTESGNISREFVGLILLPLVGNAVEHVTAVTVARHDKLNLSMQIAVGSSIQVSLCLLPILVLIGWACGQPMSLFFDGFETITLTISMLLVNFAIADGRTNYLEGYILMITYMMIALVCWFYNPPSGSTPV